MKQREKPNHHIRERYCDTPQIGLVVLVLRAGTTPILEETLREIGENAGTNENLSCGCPSIPRIAPGVAPRIVVSALLKS